MRAVRERSTIDVCMRRKSLAGTDSVEVQEQVPVQTPAPEEHSVSGKATDIFST